MHPSRSPKGAYATNSNQSSFVEYVREIHPKIRRVPLVYVADRHFKKVTRLREKLNARLFHDINRIHVYEKFVFYNKGIICL